MLAETEQARVHEEQAESPIVASIVDSKETPTALLLPQIAILHRSEADVEPAQEVELAAQTEQHAFEEPVVPVGPPDVLFATPDFSSTERAEPLVVVPEKTGETLIDAIEAPDNSDLSVKDAAPSAIPETPSAEVRPTTVLEARLDIVVSLSEHQEKFEEPQQAEVVQLLRVMPEQLQLSLAEFVQVAEAEHVEVVEQLVLQIAAVADRLHELASTDRLDSEEAQQIEAMLVECYEQLSLQLGVPLTPEMIETFLAQIRSEAYRQATQLEDRPDDSYKYRTSVLKIGQNVAATFAHDARLLSNALGHFALMLAL